MQYWFTATDIPPGTNWDPKMKRTQKFFDETKVVREIFGLERDPKIHGLFVGSQQWVPHEIHFKGEVNSVNVLVCLNWLRWNEVYMNINGVLTPVFRYRVKVGIPTEQELKVILDDEFFILFPSDYPASPPSIYVDCESPLRQMNITYLYGDEPHGCSGGSPHKLCVMNGDNDWLPTEHNVLRAIEVNVAWVVKNWQSHYI